MEILRLKVAFRLLEIGFGLFQDYFSFIQRITITCLLNILVFSSKTFILGLLAFLGLLVFSSKTLKHGYLLVFPNCPIFRIVNCQLCIHELCGGADRQLNCKICQVAGFLKVGGSVKSGVAEEGKKGRKGFGGGAQNQGWGSHNGQRS